MPANAVSTFDTINDGTSLIVTITTFLPAVPTLLIFCCAYRLIPKTRMRGGQEVPHGNLLYLDCTPQQFDPTGGDGITSFMWTIPNTVYLPCDDCHLAIVEFGLAHPLDWTTQVHPCPPVPAGGVHFDGATLLASAALLSIDAPVMAASCWYRVASNQSAGTLWTTDTENAVHTLEFIGGGNGPELTSDDPDPDAPDPGRFQFSATGTVALDQWHHRAFACFTGAGAGGKTAMVFVDGADVTEIDHDAGDAFNIASNGLDWVLGGDGFDNNTTCDLYDFWLAFGQAVDFSDPAVMALFRTPEGAPVDLGPHGEVPTGTAPTIFCHGGAASFGQPNLGTGGPLVLTGALTDTDGPS